jgi:putative ABC transport system permease protein
MLGLIATNLTRRIGRTLLTALGIGVGVATIVALLSLTQGLRNTANGFIHLGYSDFGVFQSDVSDPTASVLPSAMVTRIARQPGVARATPLLLITDEVRKDPAAIVFGADPSGFFVNRLVMLAGARASSHQIMVGDTMARETHTHVGSTLKVGSAPFRVAGVYHSSIPFEDMGAVLPLADAQALSGRQGEETTVVANLAPGARASTVAGQVQRRFRGVTVISDPDEAARAGANNLLIGNAILAIIVVALIVGGISVTNTMAMAILERQGELALLSTVGWSSARVALLILGEGVGVSLIGAAIGLLLGIIGSDLLVHALGVKAYVSPALTAWGLGRGLLVGVAIGVLGGLYPAWRATRMVPLRALARV